MGVKALHPRTRTHARAIKGIILDLDNTLYRYAPCNQRGNAALFAFLGATLKRSGGAVEAAFMEGRKKVHAALRGTGASHSRLLYIQKCIEALTGKTDVALSLAAEDVFWKAYSKEMALAPGVLDFLKTAKKRGVKIAVVSDLTAHIQMRKLVRLGVARYIDVLVTSEESGKEKPAPDSFLCGLKKMKLAPCDVVSIGDDHKKDIVAPRRMGMRAFPADDFNALRKLFFEK